MTNTHGSVSMLIIH